jgi:HlyD family secretion protein
MDTQTTVSTNDVARTLGDVGRAPAPWQKYLKWVAIAALLCIAIYWFLNRDARSATTFVTQEARRGNITVTVTATGNLQPRNQVDIGSELSGTIRVVNVDVNDEVKEGQVLAVLDTTRLEAQVLQQESSLASAQARVLQSEATLKEARANLARLLKVRELSNNKIPSQQDIDVAEAAVTRAEGDLAAARAAVAQARASLEAVRTDLSKTEIKSPINGVVLVRSIEPGSTVAASLQAPVLFTLAEDLKKMELHVAVDEADVGSVEEGQQATFTVDAYPNRTFSARITQVHYASSNTKSSSSASTSASSATSTGVVTYETVLEVENNDLSLRPGMTATAQIITTNVEDTLMIPNAALRFQPEGVQVPGMPSSNQRSGGALQALMPGPPRMGMRAGGSRNQGGAARMARVWILENGKPAMVMFRPGATDGRFTQVLELGEMPPNAGRPPGQAAANEAMMKEMQKAFERKIVEGTPVIVDQQTKAKS